MRQGTNENTLCPTLFFFFNGQDFVPESLKHLVMFQLKSFPPFLNSGFHLRVVTGCVVCYFLIGGVEKEGRPGNRISSKSGALLFLHSRVSTLLLNKDQKKSQSRNCTSIAT